MALLYISEDLKNDGEIVLAAVKQNGMALSYASRDLKSDRGVVLAAVNLNVQALGRASPALCNGGLQTYVLETLSALNTPFHVFAGTFLCASLFAGMPRVGSAPTVLQRLNGHGIHTTTFKKRIAEYAGVQMGPRAALVKAVAGRMEKWFGEQTLMDKPYVPDDSKTVEQMRTELVGKIGENIQVRRFVRMELGG